MKKYIIFLVLCFVYFHYSYAQTDNNEQLTIEITNVKINGGKVYLAVFAKSESFQKELPEYAFVLEANKAVVTQKLTLKEGYYVISAFQDTNGNGVLDYNLLGIPKEMIAITNYHGKGFPAKNFEKQKILINNKTEKVSIGLYKL